MVESPHSNIPTSSGKHLRRMEAVIAAKGRPTPY
jgi:hypothetical protein